MGNKDQEPQGSNAGAMGEGAESAHNSHQASQASAQRGPPP